MGDSCRIVVLSENTAQGDRLKPEYGLSLWIEVDGANILFDTGQSDIFAENAKLLDIPVGQADYLVVSHGHFDHTGGIQHAVSLCPKAQIHLHPDAIINRYIRLAPNAILPIGMPEASKKALESNQSPYFWIEGVTRLTEHAFITGPIPRKAAFETISEDFQLDISCTTPDPIHDDQALWIETSKGLIVILGCAHAGVVNTVEYIREHSSTKSIHAVIGGMHLMSSGPERIEATSDIIEEWSLDLLAPCHCTGEEATGYFQNHFQAAFRPCHTGSSFSFNI